MRRAAVAGMAKMPSFETRPCRAAPQDEVPHAEEPANAGVSKHATRWRLALLLALLAGLVSAPAMAGDPTFIGFIGTFSGPGAVVGRDAHDGFAMGVAQLAGRLGGVEVEVLPADDQQRVETARQTAERMVGQGVKLFVAASALPAANAAAASAALAGKGAFVLSASELPAAMAGRGCSPSLFSLAATELGEHQAMAQYFHNAGHRRVWLVAPDSDRGRATVAAFTAMHTGQIVGLTQPRPGQMSFAKELAAVERAAGELDAVYVLLSGGMGVTYIRQYGARELKGKVPLFAPGSFLDQPYLAAAGEAVVNAMAAAPWAEDLENPVSQRVAAEFESRYGRSPSVYAMIGYDTAMLLDSAFRVAALDTTTKDKTEAMRNALRRAEFQSVRGYFRFSTNHFPAQNWYIVQAGRTAKGRLGSQMRQIVLKEHRDPRAGDCPMRWEDPLAPPPSAKKGQPPSAPGSAARR